MFSGVFHLFALRKRLDIGDSPYAVIPTQFQVVAARLSCEKWYLFLYSSVFYTINHLDIYRYVYCMYMFWWSPFFFDEKKKQTKKTATWRFGGVQTIECSCLLFQSIVHNQMEEKLSNK